MSDERLLCPNCGRIESFEYRVEVATCQLWRQIREGYTRLDEAAVVDCFKRTSKRIVDLSLSLADVTASRDAAQRALSRHHAAAIATTEPFRDDARIE